MYDFIRSGLGERGCFHSGKHLIGKKIYIFDVNSQSAKNQLQTFSNTPANRRPRNKAKKLPYSFLGVFKSSKRLIHQECQLLLVR